MSDSKSLQKHLISVRVDDEFIHILKVFLIDSSTRIVAPDDSSSRHYNFLVNKGLYTLRIELSGEIKDEIIVIDAPKKIRISGQDSEDPDTQIIHPPMQYSSAPLSGTHSKTYHSSHEYYTYPAIDISKTDTFTLEAELAEDTNSSLFIFIRFPSIEKYQDLKSLWEKPFYADFELVDEYGEQLVDFNSKNGVIIDEHFGSIGFSAKLPNGIYYLIYHGDDARQIPIYVFKNWHTQFFLTLGSKPLFGTTRIFVSKNRAFDPAEKTNKYIDVLLAKLQNRDYSVDQELINIAANRKFESPMLGLICSYIYLKSSQTKSDQLFSIIANNMSRVILKENDESPDLFALKLLAAEHFNQNSAEIELSTQLIGTPMFRVGFEAIQKASVFDPNLIDERGINDYITESLYYDSPYNTFKPIPFYKKKSESSRWNIKGFTDEPSELESLPLPSFINFIDKKDTFKEESMEEPILDKFAMKVNTLFDDTTLLRIRQSSENIQPEDSWIKSAIADIIAENDQLTINDIAKDIGVSGNTVTRIISSWKE